MGKKSVKENKNIYQTSREALDLTRDSAAELMQFISADRIEKIESGKSAPHPDEILIMAEVYKNASLRNYYCTSECPIGMKHVPKLKLKDLSQIVLEIISSLNNVDKEKNRLINITVDGEITEDEYKDFASIQAQLDNISTAVRSLKLWVDQTIAEGKINSKLLEEVKASSAIKRRGE